MLTLSVSLVLFSLSRLSVAQFAAYPACVQPLLTRNFPPSCLSSSLAAQNTCLCQNANAFGSALVTGINRECGCADLEETTQLTTAYCNQVGIDIGPAFSVFIQDNTSCGGGSGSGSGGGGGTNTTPSGSASTGTSGGTNTAPGGSTSTGTGGGSGTTTGGSTSTSAGSSTSSGKTVTKSSGAQKRMAVERIFEVLIGITGGILALQWCLSI